MDSWRKGKVLMHTYGYIRRDKTIAALRGEIDSKPEFLPTEAKLP